MMSMTQIKDRLMNWFSTHAQINQVTGLDDFEFEAERDLLYPVVNVEYLSASIDNSFLNYNFYIKIGDLTNNDVLLQDEVVSDAILIAEDFFAFLQDEEGWVFRKSSTLDVFKDDGGDRVSGIMFRIVLGVIRSQNTCQTPSRAM